MPDGREDYLKHYYLWHLVAIGVLDVTPAGANPGTSCPTIDGVIWDQNIFTRDESKIALIDMGVARHHPNLDPMPGGADPQESRILWELELDLASHRHGATYIDLAAAGPDLHLETRLPHLANILGDAALIGEINPTPAEQAILNRLRGGFGVQRYVNNYRQSYATHGTACAGLVSATSFSDDQFGQTGNPILYYGVDPHSKIVPITTSISPDPEQLIAAFLYAFACGVDAILFPRDAADPTQMPHYDRLDPGEKTRLHQPGPQDAAWELFRKVIVEVSKRVPVVCAAGNDGRSDLIYPASLATSTASSAANSTDNGIIAVGSVSYRGYRSGYSNYGTGLTVVAPSDDGEIYNRHQLRLDRRAASATEFWIDNVHNHPPITEIPYSAERLISLDVPGPRGYASGSREGAVGLRQDDAENDDAENRADAVDDPGGLYTDIGGTSGAAAIVAGAVSLRQRQEANPLGGLAIKQELLNLGAPNTDVSDWYWLPDNQAALLGDAINGPPDPNDLELFGNGGLINVPRLLGL